MFGRAVGVRVEVGRDVGDAVVVGVDVGLNVGVVVGGFGDEVLVGAVVVVAGSVEVLVGVGASTTSSTISGVTTPLQAVKKIAAKSITI